MKLKIEKPSKMIKPYFLPINNFNQTGEQPYYNTQERSTSKNFEFKPRYKHYPLSMSRSFLNNNEIEVEKFYDKILINETQMTPDRETLLREIFRLTFQIIKTLDIPFEETPFGIFNALELDLINQREFLRSILNNLEIKRSKISKSRCPRVFKRKHKYTLFK